MLPFPASVGIALRSLYCGVASSVKSVWRAHKSHALRWPASEAVIGIVMFSAADAVASVTSGGEFPDARSSLPASSFGKCVKVSFPIGIHRHLTIRSSRPRVVASAVCFTLRLHTSAAPPRVGLTQALGGSMKYLDGLDIQLGDIVSVPTPLGDNKARVVMLGDSLEHAGADDDFVAWVLRDNVLAATTIVVQWLSINPFAHSDPAVAPVGDYMFTTVDEHVRLESRAAA